MPTGPLDRLRASLAERDAAGLRRYMVPRRAGDGILDLAGNDYLGLSSHPRVVEAGVAALRTWGAGSTGSRLVSGTVTLHAELEDELADFTGAAAALVFSSGYLANLGVIAVLGGPDVTILSDSANHASIVDACRLSRSRIRVIPHGSLDHLARALDAVETAHALVVTDGVYSVDGDVAPIAAMHRLARMNGALLVVDEAHALGVVGPGGRGAVALAGLAGEADIIRTVTLSKSLGAQGGAVLADPAVTELLFSTARTMIFDTGLAPASTGAALAALRILRAAPELAEATRHNAMALAEIVRELGIGTVRPDAAVVPAFLGAPQVAAAAAARCLTEGVRVGCFRPPSVPEGRSCLRLTARADLTSQHLDLVEVALRNATADAPARG